MDDLVAFLNARLDEDEAAARAVRDNSDPWPGQWKADGNYALRTHNGWVLATAGTPGGEFKPGVLTHIARHDPARVLREVAAKRAIVRWHPSEPMRNIDASRCPPCELTWPCPTIRLIAAVYSDHPDYRPEWKP